MPVDAFDNTRLRYMADALRSRLMFSSGCILLHLGHEKQYNGGMRADVMKACSTRCKAISAVSAAQIALQVVNDNDLRERNLKHTSQERIGDRRSTHSIAPAFESCRGEL